MPSCRKGLASPLLVLVATAPLVAGQARPVERIAPPGSAGPPRVTIDLPAAHAVYVDGVAVPLAGAGFDREDGDLSQQLRWSSSLDGPLGVGRALHVHLSRGAHTIVATVRDRAGNQDAATTVVVVRGPSLQSDDPDRGGPRPARGFEVLAENRYTAMAPVDGDQATVPLQREDARLAYRFTSDADRDVDVLQLAYRTVGSPADLRVSLVDDDGALRPLPGPTAASVVFTPQAPSPVVRWHRLELPPGAAKHLLTGRVYHVVVEAASPAPDALSPTDRVELAVGRARHPVAFVPRGVGSQPALRSPADPALAVLVDGGAPEGWLVRRDNFEACAPCFLLRDTLGAWSGQPYDRHVETRVAGDVLFGQALVLAEPMRFDSVSMYVRAAGTAAGPLPSDDLWVGVYADRGGDSYEPVAASRSLVDRLGFLHHGRSHWFAARWAEPVTIGPGRFVVALHAPGCAPQSTNDGYVFSYEESTTLLPPQRVPTYGGDRTAVVRSRDGGATFDVVSESGDAALVLGLVGGRATPRAVHDETAGQASYPHSACPGSLVRLRVLTRNVGRSAEDGELFARLVDPDTGQVVARTIYPALGTNEEVAEILQLGMPDRDLFLRLECGHVEGARQVVDDAYDLEVRRAHECP